MSDLYVKFLLSIHKGYWAEFLLAMREDVLHLIWTDVLIFSFRYKDVF